MTNSRDESKPHSTADDPSADLLHRWQEDGDVDALDDLLRREVVVLKQVIGRKGRGLLLPSAGVSDVAHESVLALLNVKTTPTFDDPRALRAYLWKAAWRLMMRRMRKPRAAALLSADAIASISESVAVTRIGGLHHLDQEERGLATRVALSLMKDDDRRLVERFYFDEWPISRAAVELGITEQAATMRLSRARRRLAQRLVAWHDVIG